MADRLIYRGERPAAPSSLSALGLVGVGLNSLASRESAFLCANGAINFVGALLAQSQTPAYRGILDRAGYTDMPLRDLYALERLPVGTNGTGEKPLILHSRAHAVGDKESGLVLTGNLAGMIVWFSCGAAYPDRLFNNEPIPTDQKRYRPYTPMFVEEDGADLFEVDRQLELAYKQHYYDLVDTVRRASGRQAIRSADLLFHMCEKLYIPIDAHQFAYTQ